MYQGSKKKKEKKSRCRVVSGVLSSSSNCQRKKKKKGLCLAVSDVLSGNG